MSKTIEQLKRPSLKGDVLDNHIANTYFYQRARPKIRKKKTDPYVKYMAKFAVPAALAVSVLVLAIIVWPMVNVKYHAFLKNRIAGAKLIKLIDRGVVNRDIIKSCEFRGYAKKEAPKTVRGAIILDNPKKYNWADIAMDFNLPIDLTGRSLSLLLRGNIGGENVSIVLRDTNNKSYRISDICLSSIWSNKLIRLDSIKNAINLSSVNHIRIECGYPGESVKEMDSPIDVMLYIKNINILKETRI